MISMNREFWVERTPLGSLLRGSRVRARLTQIQVAAALGVTQGAVSRWESGSTQPRLKELKALVEMYKIDYETAFEAVEDI